MVLNKRKKFFTSKKSGSDRQAVLNLLLTDPQRKVRIILRGKLDS